MSAALPLRKKLKHFFKKLESSSYTTTILGAIIYAYAQLVGFTTRWQKRGLKEVYNTWRQNKAIILIIWHGRTLLPCHFWYHKKQFPMSALVSPHRDGRMIAAVLKYFGIKVIDGSSNENAKGAALSLMTELQNGNSITIIPDGPKGPNMKLSQSALFYAQKTGLPIIGLTYSVKNAALITKSWDSMLVPAPFSKGIIAATEPFFISDQLTSDDLEKKRLEIETALTQLTWDIDHQLGLPKVEQGKMPRTKKYPKQGN